MNIKGNIFKGIVTSLAGIVLIFAAVFLWFGGIIHMIWEGAVTILLGVILLLAPDSIVSKISEFIKAWGGKSGGSESILDNYEDKGNKKTNTDDN